MLFVVNVLFESIYDLNVINSFGKVGFWGREEEGLNKRFID